MKDKLKIIIKRILMIAQGFIPLLLFILLVNICIIFLLSSPTITNVKLYSRIYNKEIKKNENLIKHFPEKIPENAESVYFYYTYGITDNRMEMKLEFKASEDEINSYIDRCIKIYGGHSYIMGMNPDGTVNNSGYCGLEEYGFNLNQNRKDLTIYFLSQPENHIAFIAVNKEMTEILFQANIL